VVPEDGGTTSRSPASGLHERKKKATVVVANLRAEEAAILAELAVLDDIVADGKQPKKASKHTGEAGELEARPPARPESRERPQFSLCEAAGAVGLSIGTKLGRGAYGTVWSATPRRDAISSLRSTQSVVIKHVCDPFETYLDGVRQGATDRGFRG
jgi:hypothetical protein